MKNEICGEKKTGKVFAVVCFAHKKEANQVEASIKAIILKKSLFEYPSGLNFRTE